MKPEFSQVLLPGARIVTGSSFSSSSHKWLALMAAVFVLSFTSMIVFYEIKFAQYEIRVSIIEEDLSNLIKRYDEGKVLEQYYETEFGNLDEDELEDGEDEIRLYGEVKLDESTETEEGGRSKRQIPVPIEPVYDPNVARTADGVPILDNSYLGRIGVPTPGYVHFSNIQPTHDSEGLRLYESLIATGGRGEPRSADYYPQSTSSSGILPHHRTSAAWVERPETRGGLQLKSGDTDPKSDDDIFYTRSGTSTGSRSSFSQQRSSSMRTGTSSVTGTGQGTGESGQSGAGVTGGASSSFYSSNSGSASTSSHLSGRGAGGNTVINRASRVPATGDFLYPQNSRARTIQYPPLKRIGQGDGEVVARVLQADNESESNTETTRPSGRVRAQANLGDTAGAQAESRRTYKGGYRQAQGQNVNRGQYGHGQRRHAAKFQRKQQDIGDTGFESDEVNIVKAEAWVEGQKAVAAHYVADVSNYTTQHRHYEGNGRLKNAEGIFSAWKPSDWMAGNEAAKLAFSLSSNGVVTVKQAGLYYVYSQIHYLDEHDINSFSVNINSTPFLQCTTMTETYNSGSKSNSCFTAGVTLLKENDRLFIRDVEVNRYSIFKAEKSFFGLMKLCGDSQIPKL